MSPPFSQLEVKLQVEYMSFSAHADAKGIMQLIRMAEPRSMLLVHGEAAKMEFLKGKIEQEFSESSAHLAPPGQEPYPQAGTLPPPSLQASTATCPPTERRSRSPPTPACPWTSRSTC